MKTMKTLKTMFACALSVCLLSEALLLRADAIGYDYFTSSKQMQQMIENDELAAFDDSGLAGFRYKGYGDYESYTWKGHLEQSDLWITEGFTSVVFYLEEISPYLELFMPFQEEDAYNEALFERTLEVAHSFDEQAHGTRYVKAIDNTYYNEFHLFISEEIAQALVTQLQAEQSILSARYIPAKTVIRQEHINYNLLRLYADYTEQDVNLLYPQVQEYLAEHHPNLSVTPAEDGTSGDDRYLSLHIAEDDVPTLEEMCAIAVEIWETCGCNPVGWIYASGSSPLELDEPKAPEFVLYALDAMLGDLDYDGALGVADAVLMARAVAEDATVRLSEQAYQNADYNEDGLLDACDLTTLLETIAHLHPSA